jgi:hypothetical protein
MSQFLFEIYHEDSSELKSFLEEGTLDKIRARFRQQIQVFTQKSWLNLIGILIIYFWYFGRMVTEIFNGYFSIYTFSLALASIPLFFFYSEYKTIRSLSSIYSVDEFVDHYQSLLKFEYNHISTSPYWAVFPLCLPVFFKMLITYFAAREFEISYFSLIVELVVTLVVCLIFFLPQKNLLNSINKELSFLS